jgi:hypothetical protein
MRTFSSRVLAASVLLLAFLSTRATAQVAPDLPIFTQDTLLDSPAGEGSAERRVKESLATLRIPFVANNSRLDPRVSYYASTFAGAVYVTRDGKIVYSLQGRDRDVTTRYGIKKRFGWTITESLVAGRSRPRGDGPTRTHASFFVGNDTARWKKGVATYDSVALGEVWPGVDVRLRAHGGSVEKLFTVSPGADASRIRIKMTGTRSLRVDSAGRLVAATDRGEVTFTRPVGYQERGGIRRAVAVAYRAKGRQYGFSVSGHDPALPVKIDPLLQATYLGGSGRFDSISALAVHPITGEVFVAGSAQSTDFPGTTGGAQPVSGSNGDVFVARLDSTLTTLIQATYLGGSSNEQTPAIAIHPTTGDVYVTGLTQSTDFPGTAGGAQPSFGGGDFDAFVARLNATLTTLIQSTYLGGGGEDNPLAVVIHPATGEVFVAGSLGCSRFPCSNFPGTAGGAQPAPGGGGFGDAFVARLNATLTTLSQATYLGGSDGSDYAFALGIHPATGEVYVAGLTESTDFPGTAGGAQPVSGGLDAFVARLNATLTTLIQATYLGGSAFEEVTGLAIHPTTGEVFVSGVTSSADFPGTAGGAQPIFAGADADAFVARLNATLTTLNQATYLGGNSDDFGAVIAIHPMTGEVFVSGITNSTNFPGTSPGAQPVPGGLDAFVARLNATLTMLIQAIYLGGSSTDSGTLGTLAMKIHPTTGDVFLAGNTESTDFPGTTGGAQPTIRGSVDGFVARLTPDLTPVPNGRLVVNDLVTLSPLTTSFDPTPVVGGPAGTFTITATFANASATPISDLIFHVTELSNGNQLLNGEGGAGDLLTPDVGPDEVLSSGETLTVQFAIGLHTTARFRFFVDLLGASNP